MPRDGRDLYAIVAVPPMPPTIRPTDACAALTTPTSHPGARGA